MFVVSHVNLLHIHVSTYQKMITYTVYLTVVLERTVRFLTIVTDVALEEKHVSIVFGQTYVKTSNNSVCSSSK